MKIQILCDCGKPLVFTEFKELLDTGDGISCRELTSSVDDISGSYQHNPDARFLQCDCGRIVNIVDILEGGSHDGY